eukprot:353460-Chlamydomonas_euryale.AAC.19
MIDVSERSPVLIKWWCTAPTAASIGTGASSGLGESKRSLITTHCAPAFTAASTSAHSARSAASSPPALPTSNAARNDLVPSVLSPATPASSDSSRIGLSSCTCLYASPLGCSRLPRAPRRMSIDMTMPSRSGSIAGLVTCAKRCLK